MKQSLQSATYKETEAEQSFCSKHFTWVSST